MIYNMRGWTHCVTPASNFIVGSMISPFSSTSLSMVNVDRTDATQSQIVASATCAPGHTLVHARFSVSQSRRKMAICRDAEGARLPPAKAKSKISGITN